MQSKSLLLLALVLSGYNFAQTKLIAYRSHSGNMNYFSTAEPDNLGNPPMMFDTLFLINDSMMIRTNTREGGTNSKIDTITNPYYCKKPQAYIDSARAPWSYQTVIVKEDEKNKKKPAAESKENKVEQQNEVISPVDNNTDNSDGLQPAQSSMLNYFLISLAPFLVFIGGFVWFANRSKMLSSE
jgi:ATP-dependent Zn protease